MRRGEAGRTPTAERPKPVFKGIVYIQGRYVRKLGAINPDDMFGRLPTMEREALVQGYGKSTLVLIVHAIIFCHRVFRACNMVSSELLNVPSVSAFQPLIDKMNCELFPITES